MVSLSKNCESATLPTLSESPPHLTILYGSQTGVARRLAERIFLLSNKIIHKNSQPHPSNDAAVSILPMNAYQPMSRLPTSHSTFLFICSTTGHGSPPDDMQLFWRRLMHRSLPANRALPSRLRFACLGIGDSSYPRFNVVALKLYRRLVQLGASPLPVSVRKSVAVADATRDNTGMGLADEQHELGLNGLLNSWLPDFWDCLLTTWGVSARDTPTLGMLTELPPPRFDVTLLNDRSDYIGGDISDAKRLLEIHHFVDTDCLLVFNGNPLPAVVGAQWFGVTENQRVTSKDHFQDTRLITVSPSKLLCTTVTTETPAALFQPGDALFVQPVNRPEDVLCFLTITKTNPGVRIQISTGNLPPTATQSLLMRALPDDHVDCVTVSAAWLTTHYLDLNALPPLFFFTDLALLAGRALKYSDTTVPSIRRLSHADLSRLQLEHDRLYELGVTTSLEAVDDLNDYAYRTHRRVLEVLIDFPITTGLLSADKWLDYLPGPILARPYSVASAPPEVQLLVAVVNYKTRMATPRLGLASTFLANLSVGDRFTGWIASNVAGGFNFRPFLSTSPQDPIIPCLLVAPGTGVAPLRSLIWNYRAAIFSDLSSPTLPDEPKCLLFFGCRFQHKDFYFADEWTSLESDHVVSIRTAFSREQRQQSRDTGGSSNDSGRGRLYVQHRLVECAQEVWTRVLSQPKSQIYVVATNKLMPAEVRQALLDICCTAGSLSIEAAESRIFNMETDGRLQMEAWS